MGETCVFNINCREKTEAGKHSFYCNVISTRILHTLTPYQTHVIYYKSLCWNMIKKKICLC